MLTTAQQQIKETLGDDFHRIVNLSQNRQTYISIMSADTQYKEYYNALSVKWEIPVDQIELLHKAVDVYDRHFLASNSH
jgi:predicted nucleic-acid-binding Zn-ribbon protein